MTRMRSDGARLQGRPRIGQRERGMESVSHLTRLAILGSLVLSVVLAAVAALGFSGRANARTGSATAGGDGTSSTVRVALPPAGDGGGPPAVVAPPISQPVPQAPPVVVSGGS